MKRKGLVVLLFVAIAIVLAVVLGVYFGTKESAPELVLPTSAPVYKEPGEAEFSRVDCYPEEKWSPMQVTQDMCEERGCVYNAFINGHPDTYIPSCYVNPDAGYSASKSTSNLGDKYILMPSTLRNTGNRIQNVSLEIFYPSEDIVRFKFYDADQSRYEVPDDLVKVDIPELDIRKFPGRELKYSVVVEEGASFSIKIVRTSTGTVLWDTSVGGFDFQDQYLSISTKLPSHNVYGFGENSHESFRHDMNFRTWGLFARDQWVGTGVHNHYGVHPFYTCLEEDGHSHGVLLMNSNAMDYTVSPLPMLTYRTIGGILDFYMFLGPTPENVVQQYSGAIGRPYMPPYWSLGFQLCRYGYNSLENLQKAVNRTLNADIPLDVQYADIDHYDVRKVFTIDEDAFDGLPEYFEYLRENGMHTIIILDPCLISNETNPKYEPYEKAKEVRGFIEWPSMDMVTNNESADGEHLAMLGFVWPQGKVVFPDFFKPQTEQFWHDEIVKHYDRIKFDGLWIDMNEPANFGTNEERPWNWPEKDTPYWSLECPRGNKYEDPPYRTMAAFTYDGDDFRGRLSDKTLCMVARQGDNRKYMHYDVHNLYGMSQIRSTLSGLREAHNNTVRGLVVGRSTFPGSGKNSGHWLGDNFSTWKQMKESIIGMLEFNLFGFPYIGADICGFFSETTTELCKRWMQLGAFYPYSRNHNQADNKIDQDPANFNDEVTELSRDALRIRYTLLPYLYTLFHEAHTRGSTVVRPIFHEFPTDNVTWGLDEQFLWGPALMIAPILTMDAQMTYYLPKATWFNHYTDSAVQWDNVDGKWHTLGVQSNSKIPLFYRGGHIFPTQEYANNTQYSRKKPFHLKAFLHKGDSYGGKASGQLFWDDGDSIDSFENGNYYLAKYTCSPGKLNVRVQKKNVPEMSSLMLMSVSIVGVDNPPRVVTVNGLEHGDYSYQSQKLVINNLMLPMDMDVSITYSSEASQSMESTNWIDCDPDGGATRLTCEGRGCIWSQAAPPPSVPRCYMNVSDSGYTLHSNVGDMYTLSKIGTSSLFGGDLPQINVSFEKVTDNVLRIKIHAQNRFEVPVDIKKQAGASAADYEIIHPTTPTTGQPFYIQVKRKSTGKIIWDTSIGGLVFAEQFLQLVTKVPSKNLYGFGENRHFTYKHDFNYKSWPMFSRDQAPGWGDYGNLYSVHPYYLCVEDTDGHSHGVLLLNSNAMEVTLLPTPAVSYRTVGGILDFYVILGDTPEQVTERYTEIIGRPYLPAYWTLGFQLCRYGYNNIDNMKAAVDRTIEAKIPFDVQYGDIDHFIDNKIFTWDPSRFPRLPEYFEELNSKGIRTIIILDPFILATDPTYAPYKKAGDIFVKWPTDVDHSDKQKFNSTNMHGYVWPPGPAVFPDFLNPKAQEWWEQCIEDYYEDELKFDGLWIDMNEPANFGTNEDKPWNWPENSPEEPWSLKCPNSPLDDPPYKPKAVFGPRLSEKTLCMVGEQNDGKGGITKHYNMHSLYGWSNTIPTVRAVQNVTGERGIVISRSTYPGSGTMAGHWLGDNDSSWDHLRDSVIGILEFNLFGIPYIGADICGYFGDVTPQLCQRWMQLGAFYTYARNHNGLNNRPQDPAAFGKEIAESSRKALEVRYTLLPYLYTLFYKAHVDGSTVLRPLVTEFYADPNTYDIDKQFMWGSALLISPVMEENAVTVEAYFPEARWFDYYTGMEMMPGSSPGFNTLDAPLDYIPVHVRGGFILPTQEPDINTEISRLKPFGLIVTPDSDGKATGSLFWDDGVDIDSIDEEWFHYFEYKFENDVLEMKGIKEHNFTIPVLDTIRIFGVEMQPSTATITQGSSSRNVTENNILYHPVTKEVLLQNLDITQRPYREDWRLQMIFP